jgi:hypothetical protein
MQYDIEFLVIDTNTPIFPHVLRKISNQGAIGADQMKEISKERIKGKGSVENIVL